MKNRKNILIKSLSNLINSNNLFLIFNIFDINYSNKIRMLNSENNSLKRVFVCKNIFLNKVLKSKFTGQILIILINVNKLSLNLERQIINSLLKENQKYIYLGKILNKYYFKSTQQTISIYNIRIFLLYRILIGNIFILIKMVYKMIKWQH